MGCGASSAAILAKNSEFTNLDKYRVELNNTWKQAHRTLTVKQGKRNPNKNMKVKRSGWKTVRIFVSSTFKDFHQEREVLCKKVFPDLRIWCEKRRLHLIDCDLRWGVPNDSNSEASLRACMGEIDRCYQDNVLPFFINMTSERVGWIPRADEVPPALAEAYKWINGLSVTEMEILHAAYRNDNPNAIFLMRNPDFLNDVPDDQKRHFFDNTELEHCQAKLDVLKKLIQERFPDERLFKYDVEYNGVNHGTGLVELGGLDKAFFEKVYLFFKERISSQYPPLDDEEMNPWEHSRLQHQSFVKSRCESVLGRDAQLKQIHEYVCGVGNDAPFLVLGSAGTGKSSVMARVADFTESKALAGQIPGAPKGTSWYVFYHFVGAAPGSTELEQTLKRFLRELGICDDNSMPTDLENTVQVTYGALTNVNTRPVVIVMDACNQFDDDSPAQKMSWVPRKLAPQVRCVLSMIADTPPHISLRSREPEPHMLPLLPLSLHARREIVEDLLAKYSKKLDQEQMNALLSKQASENPLWLSIACEELRVFGQFRHVSDKINQLADGLLELETQVLSRFDEESGGFLLSSTLCLLEASNRGMLEVELLTILGNEDSLFSQYDHNKDDVTEKEDRGREKEVQLGQLPAYKWSEVYRSLRPFLRPFGDSGEGRMDFYHRSISKCVRNKYFVNNATKLRWHNTLADFFDTTTNLNRKLEEYPYHLKITHQMERYASYLTEWSTFDLLFNEEYSSKLIALWQPVGTNRMDDKYTIVMQNLKNNAPDDVDALEHLHDVSCRFEQVARLLSQAGRFDKAKSFCDEGCEMEVKQLNSRPERMMNWYWIQGSIEDEILKQDEFQENQQVAQVQAIIKLFEKAVELRKAHGGNSDASKFKIGLMLNRMAFFFADIALRDSSAMEYYDGIDVSGATNYQERHRLYKEKQKELREIAFQHVAHASDIFKELKDELHVADCLTTKGVCYGDSNLEQQLKCYYEAKDMITRVGGEFHHMLSRVHLNIGISHELLREYKKAYESFYNWYTMSKETFGSDHPRTRRCINTLNEPLYKGVGRRLGREPPTMETNQTNDDSSSNYSGDF